jgi:hypothetical protein
VSSSKRSSVSVKSSGKKYSDHLAGDLGIDASKEMDRLKLCLSDEMSNIHRDMFRLMPTTPPPLSLLGGGAAMPALLDDHARGGALALGSLDVGGGLDVGSLLGDESLVRLDADSIRSCVDKAHGDRLKLNFDVTEYESESISVKTVGNKIEVHAQKKSKKGGDERSEEFSRVYELPTSQNVDPSHVTSSIFQDGVLTIELPVAEALEQ